MAARAAWAKGGEDTVILSVGTVLAITDAFVITSGSNPRQVRTITEEVEEQIKQAGGPAPLRIEGLDDARWVLMDYGDFVVHVMLTKPATSIGWSGCGPTPSRGRGRRSRAVSRSRPERRSRPAG